jgi:hypothetical protein
VPHTLGEQRATVPRIVLPITSRGLEVTDRLCWAFLGAAMAAAAGLILYLNRGTVFFVDEFERFLNSPTLGPVDVIEPHAGHLTATSNLVYRGILEAVGADYVAFRVLAVSVVLLAAGLFYEVVKRRIGALPALAPTLLLLFFGSSWEMIATGLGFNVVFSIAMGLGALLALERRDRLGDAIASLLLIVAVATLSIGLAFLVGVAIYVLLRPDRWRRAWIFIVPLVLYAAWWLWALSADQSAGEAARASNALLTPNYIAESLAAVTGAIAGLSFDFSNQSEGGVWLEWGRVLAVPAAAALVVRLRRGNVPVSLWASLGIVLAFWTLGALVTFPLRPPGSMRYVYTGAVAVLLVASDAARTVHFSRLGLTVLFGACAISLTTNLALLRDGAASFRDRYSAPVRADLAAVELARDRVDPEFNPVAGEPALSVTPFPAGEYLAAVDRYGSPAFSPAELAREPESVREGADQVLARALDLELDRSGARPVGKRCQRIRRGAPGEAITFELPTGGARVRTRGGASATAGLRRFAEQPSIELGKVRPGETAALEVPPDASPTPWRMSIAAARSVEVCGLR